MNRTATIAATHLRADDIIVINDTPHTILNLATRTTDGAVRVTYGRPADNALTTTTTYAHDTRVKIAR